MAEDSSDRVFPHLFANNANGMTSVSNRASCNVVEGIVETKHISEILSRTNGTSPHIDSACAMYAAAIPAELADNLPEGTVFRIMPDATILTTVPASDAACETIVFQGPTLENAVSASSTEMSNSIVSVPNYAIGVSEQSTINHVLSTPIRFGDTDIDLSFLTESDEPAGTSDEILPVVQSPQKQLQPAVLDHAVVSMQEQQNVLPDSMQVGAGHQDWPSNTQTSENCETVVVDVSKPIQLSQNTLIVVDGKKCVLQHDPETGQVIAYPVKEPEKPKKKRGRPRKVCSEDAAIEEGAEETRDLPAILPIPIPSDLDKLVEDDNAKEKGLSEVVTDDGALVRRSMRKRKRARILSDYETGNLNQELGSDAEDNKVLENDEDVRKRGKSRGPGRPRKNANIMREGKRLRGRPRRYDAGFEPTQAFLIQTADGQSMMIQVPLSSIPAGMSLQDVAQGIANNFNLNIPQAVNAEKEPVGLPGNDLDAIPNVSDFLNRGGTSLPVHVGLHTSQPPVNGVTDVAQGCDRMLQLLPSSEGMCPESTTATTAMSSNVSTSTVSETLSPLTSSSATSLAYSSPTVSVSDVKGAATSSAKTPDVFNMTTVDSIIHYDNRTTQAVNERFPDNFMADSELNSISVLSEPNFGIRADRNEKSSAQCVDDGIASSQGKDKDSGQDESLCKNLGIGSDFYFPFTSGMKKKTSNSSQEKSGVGGDLSVSTDISDSRREEFHSENGIVVKSESDATIRSVISDHEYMSRDMLSKKISDLIRNNANIVNGVLGNNQEPTRCSTSDKKKSSSTNIRTGSNKITSSRMEFPDLEKNNSTKNMLCLPMIEFGDCQDKSLGKDTLVEMSDKVQPFDIQKCLASPPEVTISWSDVTSILSSCEEPVSSTSTSKTLATVIPLSKNNPPLLMSKLNAPDTTPSSIQPEKYTCSECDHVSSSSCDHEQHLITHRDEKKQCKCCSYVCLLEEELVKHYKNEHPRCICTKCNYVSDLPYVVKRHMHRHIGNGCSCDICGKIYKDHYILKMHVKMVHLPSDVFYKCDLCPKEFNRKAHLKRHLRTHDPDKPYKCSRCSYRGSEKSDVTKHMLVHEAPKHTCDICGRVFRHVKNRDLHVKRHNGQRDFKCGACEFFGYTFTDIRRHIERKHKVGQDPSLVCDVCGISFKTPEQLKAHQISRQCELIVSRQNTILGDPSSSILHIDNNDVEPVSFDIESCKEEEVTATPVTNTEQRYSVLPEGVGLTENQVVISSMGEIINSNGRIIISGLDGTESLSATNLAIIASTSEKNSEVVIDSVQVNDSLLKLFDEAGLSSGQN